MRPKQTLWTLSSRLIHALGQWLTEHKTDAVLVQGDTSSALFGALAAFYHQIPVGHIEAGLRTQDRYRPFPEEMNRRLISSLATWHFTPTEQAAKHLRASGIPSSTIFLTGNTVIDTLHTLRTLGKATANSKKLILVTCHRRENLGKPLRRITAALAEISRQCADATIVFPLHPNPMIRQVVHPALSRLPNVQLTGPLPYREFITYLSNASVVLTDSGGVQEEATALGKAVLVLRNETERLEGIAAGTLKIIGTETATIIGETQRLLTSPRALQPAHVFGDGRASHRIVRILERYAARRLTAPMKSRK